MNWLVIYLVVINIASFAAMLVDKHRAKNYRWRIPEKTLFSLAILGGSIGDILGMWLVRHKTRHWYFVWGMPAILAAQILLCLIFRDCIAKVV